MTFFNEWKEKVLPKSCQGCNRAQLIVMSVEGGKNISISPGCQTYKDDRERRNCFNSGFKGCKY